MELVKTKWGVFLDPISSNFRFSLVRCFFRTFIRCGVIKTRLILPAFDVVTLPSTMDCLTSMKPPVKSISLQRVYHHDEWLNDQLKVDYANSEFFSSTVTDEADKLIDKNGVAAIEKCSPSYTKLCAKILEINIRLWPTIKKARLCDFSFREDIPKAFPEIAGTIPIASSSGIQQEAPTFFTDFHLTKQPDLWETV